MAGPELLQKEEKKLGVPVEVPPALVKAKTEELRKLMVQFAQIDREFLSVMKGAKRDPTAFFYAMQYEADRAEQGGGESFKGAYKQAFGRMQAEWLASGKTTTVSQNDIISRIDFTLVSRDSFLVYLYFADRQKALGLRQMFLEAWKAHDTFSKSIRAENLGEQLGRLDSYWDAKSNSFRLQSDFREARAFVDLLEKPAMPVQGEPGPAMSEQAGPRIKYRLAPRPAIGHELLANPADRLKYFEPSSGTWLDKGSIEAMKRPGVSMSLSDSLKLLPLIGPLMDVKKKIDEISVKGKIPTVRTWDPFEKRLIYGNARPVLAYEIKTWNPMLSDYTITYQEKKPAKNRNPVHLDYMANQEKKPGEKPPVPIKVFDPEKKKAIEGKVAVVEGLEIESWNPFTKGFEKRVTERPKPGAADYGELVAYVAMATLDGIFVMQTVGRTAVRGAGAKAFIRRTDQELYVSALENLDRSESVRLLNIAREKRSWGRVAKDLRKMARGGEVSAEVMKKYIEKEWGSSIDRRMVRRVTSGTSDFFGNALAPLSRSRFQSRMAAEFFNEMRHTTDFKAANGIMKSLRAAGLSPAQERLATRAVFGTLTSFSRKTQRLFLAEMSKPGGWARLIKAIEKEGVEAGIARIVPYYSKAKGFGPNFRALEFVAYGLVVPVASKKPMEALGKHLEYRLQMKAQEIEDMQIVLELSEKAGQIFPRRPGAQ